MLLPPTGWLESVSGEEQSLFCRCSESIPHCACLLLQPVCGSACAKNIKSLLCSKHSRLVKEILASHETHMHLLCFDQCLLLPSLTLCPDAGSCQCLSGFKTTSLGRALANADMELLQGPYSTHLSLSPLACLILKSFYIYMDAISPRQCNDVLGFSKYAQKASLCTVFCRKTHAAFLEPYWFITPVFIWLITMLNKLHWSTLIYR